MANAPFQPTIIKLEVVPKLRSPITPFSKEGGSIRWNFICPPNKICGNESRISPLHSVDISTDSGWSTSHKSFHMSGGKQYCWDAHLAPSSIDIESTNLP